MSEQILSTTDQEAEKTGHAVGVILWVIEQAEKGNYMVNVEQAIAVGEAVDQLSKFDQKGLEILFEGALKIRGDAS